MYVGHTREDGEIQPLESHLRQAGELAKTFADEFDAGEIAFLAGVLHDLGKYLPAAQNRLVNNGPKTDHSTAGARYIWEKLQNPLALMVAYCVAGHHGGLPNGGIAKAPAEATLYSRLGKKLEGYSVCLENAPEIEMPRRLPDLKSEAPGFTATFFIRMLFSCLVDADFLDTENFMLNGSVERGGYDPVEALLQKLEEALAATDFPPTPMNRKRAEIQQRCARFAKEPPGLYTLTVPTGGGKTISSLRFALAHAQKHGMRRVLYVLPYTSIIEQNSAVFSRFLGDENVLAHYATAQYDNDDETRKYLSCENWDPTLIVTTNVQFFSSLFSNRTSACRKLHNIAGSVIIFDEAQMLPVNYLVPCVNTIAELVLRYGCTAVLCTATQSSLGGLFPKALRSREISANPAELYAFFNRVRYVDDGPMDNSELAAALNAEPQVLCIVNNKRHAKELFALLEGEGTFHLSTAMYPAHRAATLQIINERLKEGEPCRVVSTSLIEAGVDIDFPVVYRALAGLDSIIQAGGRCNREGKNSPEESRVHVFAPEEKYAAPPEIRQAVESTRAVMREFEDIASPEAIRYYFEDLIYIKGREALDVKKIVPRLENGMKNGLSFPFADIAKDFTIIEDDSVSLLVADSLEAQRLAGRLKEGYRSRRLLREAGKYSVAVPKRFLKDLLELGVIEQLDEELFCLVSMEDYSGSTGFSPEDVQGRALFT